MSQKKFFENFDRVVCINLPHRVDRKIDFVTQCEKYDLGKFDFFNAFNGNNLENKNPISNGNFGLILSNIEILKQAKKDNLNNILIIEDDCAFNDKIQIIDEYLKMLPDDWDMFYIGGNHNIGWKGTSHPIYINDKIVKLHYTFTTHFVAINNKIFNIVIDRLSKFQEPIDVIYTTIQKDFNVYCTKDIIATQKEGYSDIENKVVNYSNMIK
jgi:GR25 family glycosyltransferase involved in LPS biosynthesis